MPSYFDFVESDLQWFVPWKPWETFRAIRWQDQNFAKTSLPISQHMHGNVFWFHRLNFVRNNKVEIPLNKYISYIIADCVRPMGLHCILNAKVTKLFPYVWNMRLHWSSFEYQKLQRRSTKARKYLYAECQLIVRPIVLEHQSVPSQTCRSIAGQLSGQWMVCN